MQETQEKQAVMETDMGQEQPQEEQAPLTAEEQKKQWDDTYKALMEAANEKELQVTKGVLEMETPILCRGEELKEIAYDFSEITSEELMEAMDKNMGPNAMSIIPAQQFAVFGLACRGFKGLDEKDIQDRMQAEDGFAATLIGGEYLNHLENQGYLSIIFRTQGQEDLKSIYKYGSMNLKKPVEGPDGKVTALNYNFSKLTGSKFSEVLSVLSRTPSGFSYKQARRLFLEAVKIAQGWNDLTMKKVEAQLCLHDIFAGQRAAIGFYRHLPWSAESYEAAAVEVEAGGKTSYPALMEMTIADFMRYRKALCAHLKSVVKQRDEAQAKAQTQAAARRAAARPRKRR